MLGMNSQIAPSVHAIRLPNETLDDLGHRTTRSARSASVPTRPNARSMRRHPRRPWSQSAGSRGRRWRQHRRTIRSPAAWHRDAGPAVAPRPRRRSPRRGSPPDRGVSPAHRAAARRTCRPSRRRLRISRAGDRTPPESIELTRAALPICGFFGPSGSNLRAARRMPTSSRRRPN